MKERKFIQTTVNKLLVTEFIRRDGKRGIRRNGDEENAIWHKHYTVC